MAGGYGSASADFRRLADGLKLRAEIASCEKLMERIGARGLEPTSMPAALAALDRLAEAADHDLRATDQLAERRLAKVSEVFEANETAIGAAYDAAVNEAESALSLARGDLRSEGERLERELSTAKEELRVAEKHGNRELADEAARVVAVVESSKAALPKSEAAADASCREKKRAAADRRDSQRRDNEGACNAAREECQRLANSLKREIERLCVGPVGRLVSPEAYDRARARAHALQVVPGNLAMPELKGYRRPPLFLLGSVYLPTSRNTSYGGRSVFDHVCREALAQSPDGSRAVRMPLVRDLARGLRVIFKSTEADAGTMHKILRSLTLRLLLAYPPTALNVALVDPMRNGKTFSGMRQIVDLGHENVLPEIVVTQEGIRGLLKSLVDRMAQHLGNYSDPIRDAFFSHQAVQAIVINDFPYGFDAGSLSDLAKIMVSGASLGTVVLISLNQNYVRGFEDNADYKAILGSPGTYVLSGTDNWFRREGQRLYVRISQVEAVERAEGAVRDALHKGICGATGRVLSFEEMFGATDDANAWRRKSSIDGAEIPVGITGGNQRAVITVGHPAGTSHHGLVGGATGAGKSSLLHTMIMSTLLSYSAEEVQLVLIDFKEGDEFAPFARWNLPSIKSVTTTTKPELALASLEDVDHEWDYRASLRMDDYGRWRREHPGEFMPRIIVIFDEVQELLSPKTPADIRERCLEIIGHLTRQGRSHGIHVFLASQSFGNLGEIMALSANMGCRIALEMGTGILTDDGALKNAQVGAAIINEKGGSSSEGNQLVQVALLEKDREVEILRRLQGIYDDPMLRAALPSLSTKLYHSALTDNPRHPICRLADGVVPARYEGSAPMVAPGYVLSQPGVVDAYESTGKPCRLAMGHNLLMVGSDPGLATKILVNLALSLSLDDLARQSGALYGSNRVVLGTFRGAGGLFGSARHEQARDLEVTDLDVLPCVRRVSGLPADETDAVRTPFEEQVDAIHAELGRRAKEGFDGRGCYVLVLFGLGDALDALSADVQALGGMGEKSLLEKVQDIVHDGPRVGIQTVVWASSLPEVSGVLGKGARAVSKDDFAMRIAFGRPTDELLELTGASEGPLTRGSFVLRDRKSGALLFAAPLDLPQEQPREWLARLGRACGRVRASRDGQAPRPW